MSWFKRSCEKHGHKIRRFVQRLYIEPGKLGTSRSSWYVIYDSKIITARCKRCGKEFEQISRDDHGYSSFTCPSSMAEAIREKGCYILDKYWDGKIEELPKGE